MRAPHLSLAILSIALLAQAFLVIYGFGFAEDSYVHAEIVRLISNDLLHPVSYEPFAPILLTYPLLFHYLALLVYFFGANPFKQLSLTSFLWRNLKPQL